MKKLLFLLLLPVLCIGQDTTSLDPHRFEPPLEWFDTVQKGYWQITVDGDTLPSRFDRFDTAHHEAMELAESYAPLDDYPVIRIIPPYWEADYRFNHAIIDALRSISVVPQEYSLLKNVRWHHEIDSAKAMHKITIQGESDADWVRFRFAGQDRAQRPDSTFIASFWTDSLVTLPLRVTAVQINQFSPNWEVTWTDSVYMGVIDTLGTASILDLKKKEDEMAFPDPVDRLEFEIPRDSTDVTLDWSDTESNNEVNGTSMSVNAGEMILILGGAEAQHPDVGTPVGYTELFNIAVHSDNGSHYAFYKEASGGETSVTIPRNSTTTLAIHVARIQGWNSIEAATTQGFASNVNAPSLSPTFSTPADILWYITLGLSDDNEIPSAAPTNYSTNLVTTLNPSGSSNLYQTFSSSWRKNNASSEDPDSWSNSSQWYGAATIAIEPGSKGAPAETKTVSDTGQGSDAVDISADVPVQDTGQGSDAVDISADVPVQETGQGVDSPSVSADIPVSDAGAGSDADPSISADVPIQETGQGVESISTAIEAAVQETAAGAAGVSVEVTTSVADEGSGSGSLNIIASIDVQDAATGAEAISVLKEVLITVSDVGTGTDQVQVSADVSVSDEASAADNISVQATISVSDTGAGTDATPVIEASIPVSDVGTGTEAISVLKEIVKIVTDSGSGTDEVSVDAETNVQDTGQGSDEVASVDAEAEVQETGQGSDEVSAEVEADVQDIGQGADNVSVSADVVVNESGQGSDQVIIDVSLSVADTGEGVESISVLQEKLIQIADAGHGSDNVQVNVEAQLSEEGFASESLAIESTVSVLDEATGVDAVTVFNSTTYIADITFSFTQRRFEYAFSQRSLEFNFKQRSFSYEFEGQN